MHVFWSVFWMWSSAWPQETEETDAGASDNCVKILSKAKCNVLKKCSISGLCRGYSVGRPFVSKQLRILSATHTTIIIAIIYLLFVNLEIDYLISAHLTCLAPVSLKASFTEAGYVSHGLLTSSSATWCCITFGCFWKKKCSTRKTSTTWTLTTIKNNRLDMAFSGTGLLISIILKQIGGNEPQQ